jgi:integrase
VGSVRRSHNGQGWEARYRDVLGRQRSRSFASKADARAFLGSVDLDIAQGTWRDPNAGRVPFAQVAKDWLASNPTKRPTTYARDATVIRVHLDPALGRLPLNRLTPGHIQEVVNDMVAKGLQPRTVRTNYAVLRAVLAWSVDTDLIDRTPCRRIRLPPLVRTTRPVVSAVDVSRLAAALPADYRCAVYLGALGLRQAEVLGLHVNAVDLEAQTITVESTINEVEGRIVAGTGKTEHATRTFALPRRVADELAAHLERTGRHDPDDLVFQAPKGGPVRATNFRLRVYDPALRATGLEGLSFHRLRHSAGHMMRELGVPIDVIQRRLGHASIRTTADIYGSLPEQVDRRVADQLDGLFKATDPPSPPHDERAPPSRDTQGW